MQNDAVDIRQIIGEIFLLALTLIFVVFKLMGVIQWSWWWVFAPIWLPTVIVILVFIVIVIVCAIKVLIEHIGWESRHGRHREKMWRRD